MQSTQTTINAIGQHAERIVILLDGVTIDAIPFDTTGLANVVGTTCGSGGAILAPTTPFRLHARRIILSRSDSTFINIVQDSAATQSNWTLESFRDTISTQVQPATAGHTRTKRLLLGIIVALAAIAFIFKRCLRHLSAPPRT